MRPRPSEEGAALLTVLLIVAVMAVLAASALERLKLATHLSINTAAIEQARGYALAAEAVARFRIGDVLQRDTNRTTLAGNWAGVPANFPIDGGTATARLDDGGNCFNLNALVERGNDGLLVARPLGMVQFARLLTLLGEPGTTATTVAAATADWIDSDTDPLPGGAEDAAYARDTATIRTGNTLMIDRSELRTVIGVTPELYARLAPFICALPVTDSMRLNINTLPPSRAVLVAALDPGLDPMRVATALGQRPANGFASLNEFWSLPPLAGAVRGDQLALTTRWFDLTLIVALQGAELEEYALIDAAKRPARIVLRNYGERG